jgi:NADPH2:quinone reductase
MSETKIKKYESVKTYVSAIIEAPVPQLWAVLENFESIPRYYPTITSCEIEGGKSGKESGAVRVCEGRDPNLGEGIQRWRETLLAMSAKDFSMSYDFVTRKLDPFKNYVATTRLRPVTDSGFTFIEWSSEVEVADELGGQMGPWLQRIYTDCILGLRRLLLPM